MINNDDDFSFEEMGDNYEDRADDSDEMEELDFGSRGFGPGGDSDDDWYYGDDDDASEDFEDYGFSETDGD